MAEDTRLAEACLLLNYSEQSYKEHMSSNQCTLESPKNHSHKSDTSQLVEICPPSPLISIPIKQEQVVGSYETVGPSSSIPDQSSAKTNLQTNGVSSNLQDRDGCFSLHDFESTQPMNSLLAAVNCALPSLKSRPTILQRSCSLSTPSRSFTNQSNLSDHDYCQSEHGLSTIDFTETEKRLRTGVESHELVSPEDIKKPKETKTKTRRKHRELEISTNSDTKKPLKLVAIHLGAGNSHNEAESMKIARSICEEVMLQKSVLYSNSSRKKKKNCCFSNSNSNSTPPVECRGFNIDEEKIDAEYAVVQLIKLMEDHQALNCGFGSNLNMRGQVECDASFMTDRNQMWTGVGAVSGCKNPILLVKSLYDHQTIARPLGLVQPNILVGSGAKQWMRQHCPYLCIVDSRLVSSKSFGTYQKLKSRYDAAIKSYGEANPREQQVAPSLCDSHNNRSSLEFELCATTLDHGFYCSTTRDNLRKVPSFARAIERCKGSKQNPSPANESNGSGSAESANSDIRFQVSSSKDHRLDTVGAITVDSDNCFASAISSGGLLLKCKGRVGQAAIPGAGCWSEDSVAVTTTGVGEYLTLNMFAKRFYDKIGTLRLLYDLGHIEREPNLSNVFDCAMEECFDDLMRSPALTHVPLTERLAGMLSVCTLNSKNSPKRIHNKDLYLSYAHNTNSMCIAYMTCDDTASSVVMSRKLEEKSDGRAIVKTIKLSPDPEKSFDDSPTATSS